MSKYNGILPSVKSSHDNKLFFSGENLTYLDYQDIEAPVVCHPHKQPKVIQELGQTASLSCRVSKVLFKILTPGD